MSDGLEGQLHEAIDMVIALHGQSGAGRDISPPATIVEIAYASGHYHVRLYGVAAHDATISRALAAAFAEYKRLASARYVDLQVAISVAENEVARLKELQRKYVHELERQP